MEPAKTAMAPFPRAAWHQVTATHEMPTWELAEDSAPGMALPENQTPRTRLTKRPWSSMATQRDVVGHDTLTSVARWATVTGPDHAPVPPPDGPHPASTTNIATMSTTVGAVRIRLPDPPFPDRRIQVSWPVAGNQRGIGDTGGLSRTDRDRDLDTVRQWFGPALASGETLRAALATNAYPLTFLNSLIVTGKELVGNNQGRVLLLTDRAIHVAGRRFWARRFRTLYASYPIGSVPVGYADGALSIDGHAFYLNPAGYQLKGVIGTATDVDLFLQAGATGS